MHAVLACYPVQCSMPECGKRVTLEYALGLHDFVKSCKCSDAEATQPSQLMHNNIGALVNPSSSRVLLSRPRLSKRM